MLRLGPGRSLLVREERPARAVEVLRANVHDFPRAALVSLRPPELPGVSKERRVDIVPNGSDLAGGARLSPGRSAATCGNPRRLPGGALVYVDALEYLAESTGSS